MEYKIRSYPQFSACGLNCGLCPRYHTVGASKCPGCAGKRFSVVHPVCGVLSCCQRKGLEYCFFCLEYPCKKYERADSLDSFISHKNQFQDMEKAQQSGIAAYSTELNMKIQLLQELLDKYDDGRRKNFFCLAVNLFDLASISSIVDQLTKKFITETSIKEKSAFAVSIIQTVAEEKGIILQLRKK